MKKAYYFFLLLLSVSLYLGCGDDDVEPETCADTVSYASDIKPIIDNACAVAGCHVAGFANGAYEDYAGLKASADNGSLRVQVVSTKVMPLENPNGPSTLTDAEIELFDCWIADGAPDN